MLYLIVLLIFGSAIAFFAAQNTHTTSVTVANYPITDVPLYIVILSFLFIGMFVSWFLSLFRSFSSYFKIRGKDAKIKESKKEILHLSKRIHELELENERLKPENDDVDDKSL